MSSSCDPFLEEVRRRVTHRRELYHGDGDLLLKRGADRELCRRDFAYFAGNYGWMFDPDAPSDSRAVPYVPWDSQVDFVAWVTERVEAGDDAFCKKARKLGITWTVLIWLTWRFLLEPDFHALIGSRKEDTVDRRSDMSALFPKIRFLLGLMPPHLMPPADKLEDAHMRLSNLENGSRIMGESANTGFGASGRVAVAFVDELARIDSPVCEQIWEALESVGPRLFVFNPPFSTGHFAEQQMRKLPARMVRVMDWRSDPTRPDDFRERMTVPNGSLTDAQFDQSYGAITGAGRFGLILHATEAQNAYRDGERSFGPEHRRKWAKIVGWDFGTAWRKLVTTIILVEFRERPRYWVDKVIPWGRVPLWDVDRPEDSALTILWRLLEKDYGGQAEFHTGDMSGHQKESTQLSRIQLIQRFQPPEPGRGFSWVDQQRITDPGEYKDDTVLHVNTTPWKLHLVEQEIQPRLTSSEILIHADRSADLLEAANEWGWVLPARMSEHEASMQHKTKHVMAKDASADVCESFMYTIHGAVYWMRGQRWKSTGHDDAPLAEPDQGPYGLVDPDVFALL